MNKFNVGDLASTCYENSHPKTDGIIVAKFWTSRGDERYVFEFFEPKGVMYIFTPDELEKTNVTTKL